MFSGFSLRVLCACLALTFTVRSGLCDGVAIIDATGTKHFSEIQAAIDAAVDGDVLLVAAGTYKGFTIDGKGISIFGVPGANVSVFGGSQIKNQTWQRVVLSGLRLHGGFYNGLYVQTSPGLTASNNSGHIRIQNCYIVGGDEDPYWGAPGYPGIVLNNNSNVVIQNCQVFGPSGSWNSYYGGDGEDGMTVTSSSLALYDTTLGGGKGGDSDDFGGHGGDGLVTLQALVFSSNSTIKGGNGGYATGMYGLQYGGDGGDGLMLGTGASSESFADNLTGGFPGNYNAAWGVAHTGPGSIIFIPGTPRSFSIDTVVSDEQLVNVSVSGPAGDEVFLLRSTSAAFNPLPALRGIATTIGSGASLQPARPAPIGIIPPGGVLTAQVPLPRLPNSVSRRRDFMQGFSLDPLRHTTLGSPLHQLSLNADSGPDCNGNGTQDYVEVVNATTPDCNTNLVPDSCDIASGTSLDLNGNGIPDECEGP